MAGYKPLYIKAPETGLVQERQEFILPSDAFPILQNAYVWREQIKRKRGASLLGRLQKKIGTTDGSGNLIVTISNINPTTTIANPIQPGIVSFTVGTDVFTDQGGASPVTLLTNSTGTAVLNRTTGVLTITGSQITTAVQYFPGQPVMGIRIREQQNSTNDQTVVFDQTFAYIFNSGTKQFQEFISGTTWNANGTDVKGTDFFWSTNYWVLNNRKLFWVTNNTGAYGANSDPIRYSDGSAWYDFGPTASPQTGQIDAASPPNFLVQCLALLPFRGRLVAFNTFEGPSATSGINYSNRIRWAAIGNPLTTNAWRDDIRGQGGFLDIPTSEDIVAVGFVRDNLVIYCERSTWQLRYTGRSIAPFQIEKVNSELGAESTFSAVQFDTSLVGIGDKGIVECDSYKSERIDIKIPDLVFTFQNNNNGTVRVQGIRDFVNRLAFWCYPDAGANGIFPNKRLVYNYENDSWAIFDDSFTCFGNYQAQSSRTWLNTHQPWIECNFPWINQPSATPIILGGNQQGYVSQLTELTTNDVSLNIQNITAMTTTPTIITSPNHNLQTRNEDNNTVIQITGILPTDPFYGLNNQIFAVNVLTANTFELLKYNPLDQQFSSPQLDTPSTPYLGQGQMLIRDNFYITSKKFNFAEEGQSIQLGFIDLLMKSTKNGAISMNVFLDYDDVTASNTLPANIIPESSPYTPDMVFNQIIPTSASFLNPNQTAGPTKYQQRIFCPTRANYLTIEYTFSNAQMAGIEQTLDVEIDNQILWVRPAGRFTQL